MGWRCFIGIVGSDHVAVVGSKGKFQVPADLTCIAETARRSVAAAFVFTIALIASPMAWSQNAVNTATVTVPATVTDPNTANNSATDSDAIIRNANLSLVKTASASPVAVGQVLGYTLTLNNAGPSAILIGDTFSIQESLPAGLTGCSYTPSAGTFNVGTIASGATGTGTWTGIAILSGGNATLSISCTVSAAAAASITNTATVIPPTGVTDPDCSGSPVTCIGGNTGSITTPVVRPDINVAKVAGAVTGPVAGVYTATYTITVTNNGGAAGTYGALTDSPIFSSNLNLSGAGWTTSGAGAPVGGLIAGDGPYQLAPAGVAIGAGVTHTYNLSITYNFLDNNAATPCAGTPTPGSGLYNDASLPAAQENGAATDNAACMDSPPPPPQLTLTKTASVVTFVVGVPASYTLTLANTGGVATTAVTTITDTIPAGLTIGALPGGCSAAGQTVTCTVAAGLAAGGSTSFIIPVTPTAAAGASVTNSATASGGGDPTCPATGRCTGTVGPTPITAPQLTLSKTASASPWVVGVPASYTLQLSNTGTAATTAVSTITDTIPAGLTIGILPAGCSAAGQVVTCTVAAGLAAGGSTSFILPVTPTGAAGASVTNSATASGGGDPTCPAAGRCTGTVGPTPITAPQLTLSKTASASPWIVGVPASYTLQLSNTGTAATTAVSTITDTIPTGLTIGVLPAGCSAAGQVVTCTVAAGLAAGGSTSFIIPITPTEAALPSVTNAASVTGGGDSTCPVDARCTSSVGPTPITFTATLTIDKTAGAPSGTTAGSTIAYTFLVTNTGNVTLTGLLINDANLDAAAVCPVTTLAPGASTTCTGTHTITQAEINAGVVNNSATATGTPPGGGTTTSPPDTTSTPIAAAPALTIDKTAGAPSGTTAGSTIAYTFLVTNTGNVTITGIVVNDANLDAAAVCPVTTLAPGASTTCTGTHTITQAEINAGVVSNSATATGTPPGGGTTTSPPDTTSTPIAATPSLTIDKTAGAPSGTTAGSTIAYTFLVTNTGNVTLTGLLINDANLDAAAVCPVTTLAPGASTTCTGTHTITQAEINAGVVNNSATATGTPPGGGMTTSPPDTTSTPIAATPSLTIDKTAGAPSGTTAGSTIAYTFLVTNTGNVTITGLLINDANLDAAAVCPVTTLAPGASTTCTGTHTITQAEINAGVVNNSATATGTPPGGGTTTSPPDTTSTPIAAAPALTIDKTAGAPSGTTAGSTIAYTFLVTNTGNVTITGIAINDANLDAAAVCPVTTLAPGASTTCTGTHTITQAEVNAGVVNNSATATGTPPGGGTTTSPPDTTSTPIAAAPALTIDKTAGTPSGTTAGSTIAYTFLVTNTGNVTLTGLLINDANLDAAAVCPVTTLAPGASTTCTGTHTITQAEINAGVVNNSATATGTPPGGGTTTSPPDTTSTPIAAAPALTIDKTAGAPSGTTAGSTIAYTFLVTNTGNVTLTGLLINDANLDAAAVCPVTTLAPGASTICTGTHTITQAEINAGVVNNSATATGTPPGGGTTTSPPDTTSTPIAATPSLTIDKTAGAPSGTTAGSTIAYTFLVTNTGNVTITGIVVNDANLDAAAVCPVTTLAPGASTTCTGMHTITQAEVNAGTVNNSATATGTPPGGGTTTSPPDTTSTPIAATPSLTIDKTAGAPSGTTAGSTIAYTFLVTNTGNVTLTALVINDANLDAAAVCPVTTLAPGASTTCTGTHTITQAEINAGVVNNSATATGTPPGGGTTTSPPDTTSTPIAATPSLTIDKTAGAPSGSTAGSTIAYTFLVTNTGNVTITGLLINDANLDAAAVCPVTTLAPGASTTCTGTHTITQAEINAGVVNNSATATGTPPGGGTTTSPPDTTSTPIAATPSLTIDKTAGAPSGTTAGSTIAYTFLVTNTGNVTITGLLINDANLDAAAVCPVTTLAPGASTTCTGTHTITQAEINAGVVNNSATATGTPPGGGTTTSTPDTTSTPIAATPSLTIDKTAGAPSGTTAGSTIAYTFLVTNTGNVTITGIAINDANLDAAAVCPVTTLAPGASTTCTGTHTITQAEINAGVVNNSATATGTPPGGGTTTSPPDTTSTPIAATPSLTIDKTAGAPSGTTAGSTIAYTFLVTNTGNVTITGIAINDANLDAAAVCPVTTLAPSASTTCTGTHTITQAEVNAGVVNNSATATGTPPGGGTTTSPPDTTSTPIAATPSLTIDKTAGAPSGTTAGSTIAYTFLVTNTGNVTLTGLLINDANLDAAAVCPVTTLAPGVSTTCTGTHTITQAEVNAGTVNNSATATGTPPGGGTTTSPPDTTSTPIAATPSLTIDKTAGAPSGSTAGSTIAYTFLVTNTGNVTITGLLINDANLDAAAVCPVTTLAPGASTTCTGTHTITQAEVNAGTVNNSATATGTPPGGGTTTSPPDTTSTPIAATPSLTIDKTAGTPSGNTAGSTIAYTFLVTNTGNVTLTGLLINDANLDAAAVCPVTTLAPGASTTCTGTHTITQAEVNAGTVNNSATATGTPPGGGTTTSPPDTTSTPIAATPSLTIDKTAGAPSGSTAGSTIAYTFLVTNTGNVTITGLLINDANLDAAAVCPVTTLAPGASTTCTGTHTITQAEVNAGTVNNSATATGTPPGGGTTTSPPDTTSTPIAATPSLTIDKTAGTPSGNTAGSTIAYTFLVTNSGNVTITGLLINDANLDAAAVCPVTTLAPGASTTCTGTHTITQAEINAGVVNNSATATGTPPGGGTTTSPPDTTSTPIAATPSLTIDKTAGAPSGTTAGSTIAYTFLVTNTGNVTITGLLINDANLDAAAVCPVTTLAPGASTTCTGTHTITQAEINAGVVNNSATATGTPPGGGTTTSPPDTTSTPIAATPSLTIDKTAGAPSGTTAGSTIAYTFLVTNTGNVTITGIVVNDANLDAAAVCPVTTLAGGESTTCTGIHTVTQAEVDAGVVNNSATVTGTPPGGGTTTSPPDTTSTLIARAPQVTALKTVTITTDSGVIGVADEGDVLTYGVTVTNAGNVTLTGLVVTDSFEGRAPTTLTCTPTTLAPGASAVCAAYTYTVTAADVLAGGTLDNVVTATATSASQTQTVSSTSTAVVNVNGGQATVRIIKTASPRDVKVGDLVRYTLTMQNTGVTNVIDGTLVDTPPGGFNYVDGSLTVADADNAGRLVGTYPIRVDQIDIPAGETATITYLLRVGAGVRAGVHTNSAVLEDNGSVVSNVATADVQLVGDPLLDESLIIGTVWNDRDSDGWQDVAGLADVRVQGGFAAEAYVVNSTTVDRGNGPTPEADASSPMLHGIDVGKIAGRQSEADPAAKHQVVIRQTLRELRFTDDFVLTSAQGATVRMAADGTTRVEKSGDAAKGLNSAEPTVERRVSQVADGYLVEYVIGNAGIDERGIPGVRIASVEGLLVETDQYGRYRLVGVDGGRWERGRNFILKVDPATLPPGSTFTTDNPLVRRVTPGLPTRFDFGVKLPSGLVDGAKQSMEMEMGSVMFAPGSADIRPEYRAAIDKMAETAQRYGGGEVVIAAEGDSDILAFDRAVAVRDALVAKLPPEVASATRISVRANPHDPSTTVVGVLDWPLIGTVLFETDRAEIKPEYRPLITKIAAYLEEIGTNHVAVVGHADKRGSEEYNVALGVRRAKAVFEAIAEALPAELRSKLRVDFNDDPAAPAGMNGQ
jgi:large repetitive protein